MRISKYLHQKVSVQKKRKEPTGEDSVDVYGNFVYEKPQEVPAAIQKKTQLVQNTHGDYVKVTTSVFLDTLIEEGDKIDNSIVEAVLTISEPWGDVAGYEATLK